MRLRSKRGQVMRGSRRQHQGAWAFKGDNVELLNSFKLGNNVIRWSFKKTTVLSLAQWGDGNLGKCKDRARRPLAAAQLFQDGGGDSQAAGAKWRVVSFTCTVSVFISLSAGFPLSPLVPAVCPICSPWVLPTLTLSCAFPFSPSLPHPLSWPFYFLLSILFSMWKESCPQNLSSLSAGGNDQAQETNSSYLLETSRLIFHPRIRTPKATGHTSGSAETAITSLLLVSTHSVWNTLGDSLDPPLTWNTSSTDAWKPTIKASHSFVLIITFSQWFSFEHKNTPGRGNALASYCLDINKERKGKTQKVFKNHSQHRIWDWDLNLIWVPN